LIPWNAQPAQSTRRPLASFYAPDGPGGSGSRDEWTVWLSGNRPYLFFSDTGGYRWYADPLAKARKIPTEKLRGSDRASRPAITARADVVEWTDSRFVLL